MAETADSRSFDFDVARAGSHDGPRCRAGFHYRSRGIPVRAPSLWQCTIEIEILHFAAGDHCRCRRCHNSIAATLQSSSNQPFVQFQIDARANMDVGGYLDNDPGCALGRAWSGNFWFAIPSLSSQGFLPKLVGAVHTECEFHFVSTQRLFTALGRAGSFWVAGLWRVDLDCAEARPSAGRRPP